MTSHQPRKCSVSGTGARQTRHGLGALFAMGTGVDVATDSHLERHWEGCVRQRLLEKDIEGLERYSNYCRYLKYLY